MLECYVKQRVLKMYIRPLTNLAQVDRALTATRFGWRDKGSDFRPFFIGQVTLIAQPAAVIEGAVLLDPHGMQPNRYRGWKR